MPAVRHLGEFIREQRTTAKISLRELAKSAGVSNPYLSQIERGLRKPSAEILQQIAKALRISAEALYVQAGILEQREGSGLVADAVHADEALTERQKQVLLEIYESFRKENAASAPAGAPAPADEAAVAVLTTTDLLATTAAPEPPAPAKATTGPRAKAPAKAAAPRAPRRTAAPRSSAS